MEHSDESLQKQIACELMSWWFRSVKTLRYRPPHIESGPVLTCGWGSQKIVASAFFPETVIELKN